MAVPTMYQHLFSEAAGKLFEPNLSKFRKKLDDTCFDSFGLWFVLKRKKHISDPRVKSWSFMSSPEPLIGVIVAYLIGLKISMMIMENRKPFELKRFIYCYNTIQIAACIFITHGVRRWNYLVLSLHIPHP